jgi:hypothetical protein
MNRKEFLKTSVCGLCACTAAGLLTPTSTTAAETQAPEDWRLHFVKRRYAKLLEILSTRLDEKTLNDTLRDLGNFCSSTDWKLESYRGNFEGYAEHIKQSSSGDTVTYDRENGVITVTSPERTDCFCPLNCSQTPKVVCNCSLGWQKRTWETVLQKRVTVELKESVLRGGKRCVFQIQIQDHVPAKGSPEPARNN